MVDIGPINQIPPKTELKKVTMGLIQPALSKFNSPIFAMETKRGGCPISARLLGPELEQSPWKGSNERNQQMHLGNEQIMIFFKFNLTAGFWQLLLQLGAWPHATFSVPRQIQYQWVTTPLGLLGATTGCQCLMETVAHGLPNVIIHIHELLLHPIFTRNASRPMGNVILWCIP